MIVEPNAQIQETLRGQFKDEGFRVLVTADPQRPASMFTEENQPADCVIFSTSTLGEDAFDAFNEFGERRNHAAGTSHVALGPTAYRMDQPRSDRRLPRDRNHADQDETTAGTV